MTATKTAIVTGAGRRIGQAIARALAENGYQVGIHYNSSASGAEDTVSSICDAGGMAAAFKADFSNEDEVATLIDQVSDQLGPVDLLVNNASSFVSDDWDTATRESWDLHMEANLRAPFVLMQSFAKALPEGGEGSVVNIIDQRVWNLTPNYLSYTLSKSGLWTLTRTMALALAPQIRVNAIGPGPTLANSQQELADFEAQWENIPLARRTELADICDAVLFLARARSMTGRCWHWMVGNIWVGHKLPTDLSPQNDQGNSKCRKKNPGSDIDMLMACDSCGFYLNHLSSFAQRAHYVLFWHY